MIGIAFFFPHHIYPPDVDTDFYTFDFGKCSKKFHFLFSNKMLIIRDRTHKMLVKIANKEDPDQTASSEAICSGYALFVLAFFKNS